MNELAQGLNWKQDDLSLDIHVYIVYCNKRTPIMLSAISLFTRMQSGCHNVL